MKNKLSILIFALFLVIGVSGASAYDIEITPGGVQDVSGQSTIFFDIVFNPDRGGGNTLGTYAFNLGYDTGELTWNSGNTTTYPPSPLIELFGPPSESTSGIVANFNASSFGTDASLTSSYTLVTVAFDVSPVPRTADGSPDVWFDTSTGLEEFTIDGSTVPVSQITISGISPDVYVLPEPISTILFLTGGATFGVRNYWRKRKQRV